MRAAVYTLCYPFPPCPLGIFGSSCWCALCTGQSALMQNEPGGGLSGSGAAPITASSYPARPSSTVSVQFNGPIGAMHSSLRDVIAHTVSGSRPRPSSCRLPTRFSVCSATSGLGSGREVKFILARDLTCVHVARNQCRATASSTEDNGTSAQRTIERCFPYYRSKRFSLRQTGVSIDMQCCSACGC